MSRDGPRQNKEEIVEAIASRICSGKIPCAGCKNAVREILADIESAGYTVVKDPYHGISGTYQ